MPTIQLRTVLTFSTLFALLVTANSCSLGNPVVAEVGRYKITKRDAEYRDALIKLYVPAETRKLGADQLVRAYTSAEVLNNNGHLITEEVITKEEERINQQTQMPEFLAKIKALFGSDHKAYRQVYVLPTYAERVIYYEFFLRDPRVQKDSLALVQAFIDRVRAKPETFEAEATKMGKRVAKFTVSLTEGVVWENDRKEKEREAMPSQVVDKAQARIQAKLKAQQSSNQSEEAKRWIQDVIKPLTPGQIYATPVDLQEQWEVVRYVKATKNDTYEMMAAFFPKADYTAWMESEKAKIKISVRK